jgi:methyl-accepting chemotaxis protein
LLELNGQMAVLATGKHAITIPHAERKDEIGTMSRSVVVFREQAEQRQGLEAEKQRSQAEQEKVVASVGKHLDLLAAGDLTATINDDFPPSYTQLKESFNSAMLSLGALIQSVAESTSQIRTGSSEIAQASEDLARRTESNAASLEQTSAAIVQMDGRLKASASASSQTVGRADQAIATVTGGRELADEAVQAMGRVSDSAKGIDSVIEGLDKIAFQTRVLAMNAAVEAGRAGEAGRGFAVVADLVSALAMRAEEEAKRARDQLTVTQTDIVTAVGAVEKVDAALQNISADVGEVHQLLGSMASDNQAQALAITEINAAIASMDQSTQQNAAMVEETSAAARNLLTEVTVLAEQSARFRYSDADGVGGSATARSGTGRSRSPAVPARGKEGRYQSPIKPLPSAAIEALTAPSAADDDDWNEF